MTNPERVVEAGYAALRGDLEVPRATPGYCLRLARRVLEHGLGWADQELYDRFPERLDSRTPEPRPFWARDVQASLRRAGWGVPVEEAAPGDLIFTWRAAMNDQGDYVGHVGVVMPGDFVLENIDPSFREGTDAFSNKALSLTPLTWWLTREVEVMRVPEDL